MQNLTPDLQAILDFWFIELKPNQWFQKNPSLDQNIKDKFLPLHQRFRNYLWKNANIYEALALVILFDQFSRNMFRDTKQSFEFDTIALKITKQAISENLQNTLKQKSEKQFLLMPLMHSENLEDQKESIKLFKEIDENTHQFALAHYDIIKRFGRFPHRNQILERKSTKEEVDFLKLPNSSF